MKEKKGTQPLETERLLMRRFTVADGDDMYRNWAGDPQVARWMRWAPHKGPAESRAVMAEWVAAYAKEGHYHWALVRKEDGVLMGALGIFPGHDGVAEGTWEPGYNIGRAFWGQGYTTEALRAALAWFVADSGVRRLESCHAVANPASGRVMEKAGFVYSHNGVYHRLDGSAVEAKFYTYVWEDK